MTSLYFSKRTWFQLTAARRRLGMRVSRLAIGRLFQLTAARRRLAHFTDFSVLGERVSTHSRPKAAGIIGLSTIGN